MDCGPSDRVRPAVHGPQSLHRVVVVDRQIRQHGRTDRHGHQGAQGVRPRLFAAGEQNGAEALGDGGERHVVSGHTEFAADTVDVGDGHAHRGVPAQGGDPVDRRRPHRRPDRSDDGAGDRRGTPQRVDPALVVRRWRRNLFGACGVGECIGAGVVAEPGEQMGGRVAVEQAVMGFHQDRPPVAFEPVDDPALPRWQVRVEGALARMGDGTGQLVLIARAGNRHPAHMVGEVEFRIVDPLLVDRVRPQQLCAARDRQNPFGQQSFEQFVVGHRPVDDGDRAGRQARVLIRILRSDESRIQCLRHAEPPPSVFALVPVSGRSRHAR